jgi:hypothetical protein
MYIEFQLPNASAGQAAAHALLAIRRDLGYWSMQHNIRYTEKLHKLTFKVTLPTENDYTYFGLTWDPKFESSKKFRFVEPLDRPPQDN